jgi:hypothetical protein
VGPGKAEGKFKVTPPPDCGPRSEWVEVETLVAEGLYSDRLAHEKDREGKTLWDTGIATMIQVSKSWRKKHQYCFRWGVR